MIKLMLTAINRWGPAILVCFTVLLGIILNNSKISDLRSDMNQRFGDINQRFVDINQRFVDMNRRFDDLRDLIRSEVKRLEDRLDRLERPIFRG